MTTIIVFTRFGGGRNSFLIIFHFGREFSLPKYSRNDASNSRFASQTKTNGNLFILANGTKGNFKSSKEFSDSFMTDRVTRQ
jgi:hypothetical protein